jgi:hypothetical protein
VIFYDESAATGGGIVQATAVRVQFAAATPAPRSLEVTTTPRLRNLEGWLELPQGAGNVVLSVKAANAQRVRFTLTPTGTGMEPYQAAGRGPRSQRRVQPRLALPQRPDLGASRHRGGWNGWHRWRAGVHRASIAP